MEHFHQLERDELSVDQLHQLRAREAALAALVARAAKGDQTALATLYDETSALVYDLDPQPRHRSSAAGGPKAGTRGTTRGNDAHAVADRWARR